MGSIFLSKISLWKRSGRILILLILFGVTLFPFANGFGCDFYEEIDDAYRKVFSRCEHGIIERVIYNKKTGLSRKVKGIYAKKGTYFFIFLLDIEDITGPSKKELWVINLMTGRRVITGHYFEGEKKSILAIASPYPITCITTRYGRSGYI